MDSVFNKLLPSIERGMKHGEGESTSAWHLYHSMKSGEVKLWAIHKDNEVCAGCFFQVIQKPMKKVLYVVLLAGKDMDIWIHKLVETLNDYRVLVGAQSIEASCRAGMAKYLKGIGWKSKATIMELR